MSRFGIKRSTVVSHLLTYARDGITALRWTARRITQAAKCTKFWSLKSLGSEALGPVYRALNETVAYDDLHILRLYCLNAGQDPEPNESHPNGKAGDESFSG
jgi:hypothetical protein